MTAFVALIDGEDAASCGSSVDSSGGNLREHMTRNLSETPAAVLTELRIDTPERAGRTTPSTTRRIRRSTKAVV
ncbi:hypothetical protein [Nocardia sp. CNY236]|uniref:hypothetical protein n=1 Tax=Nocardia sp. CNY236 TaxID=1169152 RepID=UPI0003F699D8|nr:hypothetical protein [Nocardia sp. CNY236]